MMLNGHLYLQILMQLISKEPHHCYARGTGQSVTRQSHMWVWGEATKHNLSPSISTAFPYSWPYSTCSLYRQIRRCQLGECLHEPEVEVVLHVVGVAALSHITGHPVALSHITGHPLALSRLHSQPHKHLCWCHPSSLPPAC